MQTITEEMIKDKHTILFDGVCNFCSFWVKFVMKRDKKDQFRFASLQSETGKMLLQRYQVDASIDSVVLIENETYYVKSTAALRILKSLGGFRSVLYALIIIPSFIRNAVYDLIAKHRYKFFGSQVCELPLNNDYKDKFI